ncbi:MAG: aldolase/citrate lyase family protein [Opitutaceae bacterium]|nr:aldolase/citrate lyase family protein [Opitutaceae bacterium]
MQLRPSRVLAQLRQGGLATSFKVNLNDPRVIEIAGLAGADAVWICQEHVPNDWSNLEHQIRAARLHNMDSLVRVAKGSYSDYVRPFEADATGIIVPHVASADEARQIVEWTRFHPLGKRALDGGNTDGRYCLIPLTDYLRHSNAERVIILQIESPEALAKVEAIAAVPGYNGIMFGPGDFSHRIGLPGQIDAPEVVAARQHVAAVARQHGKFAMTSGLFAPFETLVGEGHQLFNVGADVLALGPYAKQRLDLVRQGIAALPAALKLAAKTPYG